MTSDPKPGEDWNRAVPPVLVPVALREWRFLLGMAAAGRVRRG